MSGPQAPCDLAQCLGGWLWSQGGISLSPLPQSSESVTLDLLTYTDLESLRSRKLGGRPGALAPRSAQLNSKRYLILIYSVEFDRWARGLAQGPGWWQGWEEPQGQVPGMILLYLQSLDSVSLYCCDWLQVTEQQRVLPTTVCKGSLSWGIRMHRENQLPTTEPCKAGHWATIQRI